MAFDGNECVWQFDLSGVHSKIYTFWWLNILFGCTVFTKNNYFDWYSVWWLIVITYGKFSQTQVYALSNWRFALAIQDVRLFAHRVKVDSRFVLLYRHSGDSSCLWTSVSNCFSGSAFLYGRMASSISSNLPRACSKATALAMARDVRIALSSSVYCVIFSSLHLMKTSELERKRLPWIGNRRGLEFSSMMGSLDDIQS
jgi:hypothetical protein